MFAVFLCITYINVITDVKLLYAVFLCYGIGLQQKLDQWDWKTNAVYLGIYLIRLETYNKKVDKSQQNPKKHGTCKRSNVSFVLQMSNDINHRTNDDILAVGQESIVDIAPTIRAH